MLTRLSQVPLLRAVEQPINVAEIAEYLSTEDDVENVALNHGKEWADFVFQQMKDHYWETPTDYRAKVTRGFRVLNAQNFNVSGGGPNLGPEKRCDAPVRHKEIRVQRFAEMRIPIPEIRF